MSLEAAKARAASGAGAEVVDWLEGPHPTRRYTQAELIEIKTTYAAKARELKAAE